MQIELIDKCIDHATKILNTNVQNCKIYSWTQEWSDTSCGFSSEVVGFGFTSAECIVVIGPNEEACVYHDGKLAYHLKGLSRKFYDRIKNKNMPAASEDISFLTSN